MLENDYTLIGRTHSIIDIDVRNNEPELSSIVHNSSFLVIGGAGSIGQAVVKELFARNPRRLHVVDISENNLVELVRDLRSSAGYIDGEFRTLAIDLGSVEFEAYFAAQKPFDYVLNLSALKHVRSERDPYTLMRMIDVNILNTIKSIGLVRERGPAKYFCVSTDKAANPVNMMGASKRIMEQFLYRFSDDLPISTARFANVAFSDGSLLQGFMKRLEKRQPISAPSDVKRYFVTFQEAGQICLLSTLLGGTREIFFPKLDEELNLVTFADIARRFLERRGLTPLECSSEEDARALAAANPESSKWPCYFSSSDTTGEKAYEEFFVEGESVDLDRFRTVGIVLNTYCSESCVLDSFLDEIAAMRENASWTKKDLVDSFRRVLPNFDYFDVQKYLDEKM